jgi:hypothetical protein
MLMQEGFLGRLQEVDSKSEGQAGRSSKRRQLPMYTKHQTPNLVAHQNPVACWTLSSQGACTCTNIQTPQDFEFGKRSTQILHIFSDLGASFF